MQIGSKKGIVRTPQFPAILKSLPGQEMNEAIDQVRAFIKKQKRSKGFSFGISPGSNTNPVDISGTARIFLGFSLLMPPNDELPSGFASLPDSVTLTVNNEIIIESVHPNFFSQEFMDDEYYSFLRPLSGSDTVVMATQGVDALTMRMILYYI